MPLCPFESIPSSVPHVPSNPSKFCAKSRTIIFQPQTDDASHTWGRHEGRPTWNLLHHRHTATTVAVGCQDPGTLTHSRGVPLRSTNAIQRRRDPIRPMASIDGPALPRHSQRAMAMTLRTQEPRRWRATLCSTIGELVVVHIPVLIWTSDVEF